MRIQIHGVDLPGPTCGQYRQIFVGLQRGKEPDQLVSADAGEAHFTLEASAVATDSGYDLRSPHIHGRAGARFIYLTWGEHPNDATFRMFRRAKLLLNEIEPGVLSAAVAAGVLEATLSLTDQHGRPICASVGPAAIRWHVPAVTG